MNQGIDDLSEFNPDEKRALLAKLLAKVKHPFPASFQQERYWALNQPGTGGVSPSLLLALRVRGSLNVAALEKSLIEIVRRHEALRTTLVNVGGRLFQIITSNPVVNLKIVDLSSFVQRKREELASQRLEAEANRPFELAHGPLFRSTLLKLGDTEHMLLLVLDHAIADGWSLGILLRELSAHYLAFCEGLTSPLLEPALQYRDYAIWQRDKWRGETLENELSFWRQRLLTIPTLHFSGEHPRPTTYSLRCSIKTMELSPALVDAVVKVGREEGVTLYMTLLAVFQAILARYTSETDLPVISPVARRTRPEFEQVFGYFAGGLVFRSDLSGDPTLRALQGRVREVCLESYCHQEIPFEKLLTAIWPGEIATPKPMERFGFALENPPLENLELGGLEITTVPIARRFFSSYDLTLRLTRKVNGALEGRLEYLSEVLPDTSVEQMIIAYRHILERVAYAPDTRLSELLPIRS